jgi:ornithine carbamoyltransferase
MKSKRSFIDLRDYSREEIEEIIVLAEEIKRSGKNSRESLRGMNFGLLFGVASTRTRVSFQVGISQMGGHAEHLNTNDLQLVNHESLKDTASVLGRYLDGLVVRMYDMNNYGKGREALRLISEYAGVPVVNALDDKDHPCQVLADILTLKEKLGDNFREKKVAFSWVYSERQKSPGVGHSMLTAASLLGMNMTVAHPEGLELDAEYVEHARNAMSRSGGSLTFTNNALEASEGADVIYVKDWKALGMSKEEDIALRNNVRADWTISGEHFKVANPGALFMNCLPIIRGQQATQEVIDRPDSILYDEAENRLHIQKAILSYIYR